MFTGLVEEVGTIASIVASGDNHRITIKAPATARELKQGNSVAVSGVCLTALNITPDSFSADLAPETLRRSNLGDLTAGSLVNLERPLSLGARLSGHMVQGHVDGTAEFASLEELGDRNWWLKLRVAAGLERYMIHKGSVTLDGVSLTIASLEGRDVGVAIIPHTYQQTAMRGYRQGSRINVETDMIAKYVEKLLHPA